MKSSKAWWSRPDIVADLIAGISAFSALAVNVAVATNFVQIPWFQSNVQNITLGLISVFIVVAIFEKRVFSRQLKIELIDELKKVQTDDLQQRVRKVGVSNLYLDRADYAKYRGFTTLGEYLGSAQKTAKVVAHWMSQGIEMEGVADTIADIVKSGKTVEIAVVDPNSSALEQIASYFALTEQTARDRINGTISELLRAKGALNQRDQKRFKIKTYDTLASASVVLLDDAGPNGRVQVDIKVYKTPRQKSFGFELSGKGNPLFDLWRDSYVDLMNEAKEIDSIPQIAVHAHIDIDVESTP